MSGTCAGLAAMAAGPAHAQAPLNRPAGPAQRPPARAVNRLTPATPPPGRQAAVAASGNEQLAEAPLDRLFADPDAAQPQSQAFAAGEGRVRFVLDRSQPGFALLQFEGDPEVWALQSNWGPRGDEFLRNDIGQTMMRINSLGGITLYGPMGDNGGPAAVRGAAPPLAGPRPTPGKLQDIVQRSVRWFDRFAQGPIRVEAAGGLPPPLVAEALERAAQGMSRAPRGWFGQPQRRVRRIRVFPAARPGVRWQRQTLEIAVTPGRGFAGRPSSAAVLAALTARAG